MYACDDKWWRENASVEFEGERWTQSEHAARYGARRCPGEHGYVLSEDPSKIYFGGNSGFQAVNLAFLMGAARIVLLGYDMQATNGQIHWHPDHKCGNPPVSQISIWRKNLDRAAEQLAQNCVEPVNCTNTTALVEWPRKTLEEVFI